jgi:phosphatidylserine/phosphatidylglycerophosphate/cardiolipin synthase-like enzyme
LPTHTKRVQSRKKNAGDSLLVKEFERFRVLRIVAVVSMLALATLILVGLFAPGLRYALVPPPDVPVDASAFLNELEPLVSSKITRNNQIEVIENGENFYRAELDAMRQARHSINIEAYIFHTGNLTNEVIDVLTASAKRGVRVNLVIDLKAAKSHASVALKQFLRSVDIIDELEKAVALKNSLPPGLS